MSNSALSIITASAGTGKTYRLSLEYIRIVLQYFGNGEFSLDNILVLTFTRKATAEIRTRIVEHIDTLASSDPARADERKELLLALRPAAPQLTSLETNRILSVRQAIAVDRRNLQVMTIDAYIGSIFRNIVRPLRSINSVEIDEQAVNKRLPFLLEHIIRSELRPRVDNLLRRRISPSLDEYRGFFRSLIDKRWLYYLIESQHYRIPENSLHYLHRAGVPALAENSLVNFLGDFKEYLDNLIQALPDIEPAEMFKKDFRDLWQEFPYSWPVLMQEVTDLSATLEGCRKMFQVLRIANINNGQKVRGAAKAALRETLEGLYERMRTNLADYLVHTLLLPEQREILAIWKEVLDVYDKLIYRNRSLTFNDISWYTLEALFKGEEPLFDLSKANIATEFYLFLSHRSRFILIDEFQDTSLLQFNILKPIIGEISSGEGTRDYSGLTVVGDEKQSIFGWRGGERDLLLNLREIFPTLSNVQTEVLGNSYRSSKPMMDFINHVFRDQGIQGFLQTRNLNWNYEPVESKVDKPDFPTRIEFQAASFSWTDQTRSLDSVMRGFLTNSLQPALKRNRGQKIAILCRKTSELAHLQLLLEELGEKSIFQPSSVLPDHSWVKPLITWLRFLAFRDWLDFLAVLRSNYIMLKAEPLRFVLDELAAAREGEREPDLSSLQPAQELLSLAQTPPPSLIDSCQLLLERFLPGKEPTERDLLNIHAFLSLTGDFEISTSERDKSIPAFLDFLDDNLQQDFMKQVAVEGGDTLQLLTIHKSKGLQFDSVFVFYNLSGRGQKTKDGVDSFLKYSSPDFQQIEDFALTYHYRDILASSSYRSLVEQETNRELLEEMNTLYVAFTRAKTELHICMAYQGKGAWTKYLEDRDPEQTKLPHLIASAADSFFSERQIEPDAKGVYVWSEEDCRPAEDTKEEKPEAVTEPVFPDLLPRVQSDPWKGMIAQPYDSNLNWKHVWIVDRKNLFGDLAHHYLSFIKFDLPQEHLTASRSCLANFGAILTQTEIFDKLEGLRRALPRERIFIPGYDKVFTELSLYLHGQELRLDRLMLDTAKKRALILDFKTGGIHDPLQLECYKQALLELPYIQQENYAIDTEYIELTF